MGIRCGDGSHGVVGREEKLSLYFILGLVKSVHLGNPAWGREIHVMATPNDSVWDSPRLPYISDGIAPDVPSCVRHIQYYLAIDIDCISFSPNRVCCYF